MDWIKFNLFYESYQFKLKLNKVWFKKIKNNIILTS
jgi:hypothetical protein